MFITSNRKIKGFAVPIYKIPWCSSINTKLRKHITMIKCLSVKYSKYSVVRYIRDAESESVGIDNLAGIGKKYVIPIPAQL